jgi:hypothetical protein
MGYDGAHPYAELPVTGGGSPTTYYCDYYWVSTGQQIALVGAYWDSGAGAGLSIWSLFVGSGDLNVYIGGRLIKKAL